MSVTQIVLAVLLACLAYVLLAAVGLDLIGLVVAVTILILAALGRL